MWQSTALAKAAVFLPHCKILPLAQNFTDFFDIFKRLNAFSFKNLSFL
jgi:hypothetical protein